MRLLPRDSNFGTLASALSLAAANYKPIPQLPTSNSSQPLSAISAGGDARQELGLGRGYSFKVQPADAASSYAATHSLADWGEPSTLYVPVDANGTVQGHEFKAGRKVGPGSCPYSEEYTPKGGWQNLPPPVFPPFDPVKATVMRYRQQQGVNLGTWFVQEGWMEADFMSCATGSKQAEYDILDGFGSSPDGLKSARAYMEEHWDTFFTEDDFRKMAAMGINTVRLPIGYWSVGPTFCHSSPFDAYKSVYQFSWRYIARAINWAAKYDIGVIVDLHGAYGSQNGQAHSGLNDGNIQWYNSYNQGLTTELLVWLAKEISDVTNVIGIQLLNEPQNRDQYWSWLPGAMDAMRKSSPYAATVPLYFHDAFVLNKGANFVSKRPDFVVSDHHSYYVYTDSDQGTSAQGHISQLDGEITGEFEAASAKARRNLIVGEWSCALADSSLKGIKGADRDAAQRDFCEAQRNVWETTTAGWTFWSKRLQNCQQNPGWCFEASTNRYLPAAFNVWDLPITPFSLDTDDARAAMQAGPLMQGINAVRLPPAANSTGSAAAKKLKVDPRIGKVMMAEPDLGAEEAQDDGDEDEDQAAALLVMSRVNPVHANAPQNTISPEALTRRGGVTTQARLWARNRRLFARAATQSAAVRGYRDGFYTTKIFASQGYLSRLGFAQQYRQDTWKTYVDAGVYGAGDEEVYKQQFLTGAQAGEQAISYVISQKGKTALKAPGAAASTASTGRAASASAAVAAAATTSANVTAAAAMPTTTSTASTSAGTTSSPVPSSSNSSSSSSSSSMTPSATSSSTSSSSSSSSAASTSASAQAPASATPSTSSSSSSTSTKQAAAAVSTSSTSSKPAAAAASPTSSSSSTPAATPASASATASSASSASSSTTKPAVAAVSPTSSSSSSSMPVSATPAAAATPSSSSSSAAGTTIASTKPPVPSVASTSAPASSSPSSTSAPAAAPTTAGATTASSSSSVSAETPAAVVASPSASSSSSPSPSVSSSTPSSSSSSASSSAPAAVATPASSSSGGSASSTASTASASTPTPTVSSSSAAVSTAAAAPAEVAGAGTKSDA
ncbi:uncharacterized protein PFL1_04253 [Pseudozyma flocculosa PF-1]|uniref:Related to Glucan 1,3-beta-glucosidase n=2 Tax=Pseudozyma flocculosa TaxID=84751 RepID=A0A5C3EWS2_9BASI|nr:uncharacterized protein PFL1_04253 [Pseudozyma flocculosa PF-1]EPQ28427.1 hypothetical protein PFL1_04253 [Pseudozyma flocculosa PF-1]SPO35599.1 related to Glucan 1,3-beta-glucosidase precursor [Pseudozyma flocculosa]